jgi:zinc D-Ala-D-Ala carboxypeptidase
MNVFNSQNEADALLFDRLMLGGSYKLSRNFTLGEMASKDGSNLVLIHPALILALQAIRDHTGKPVAINSGYRSPQHNRNINGATNSLHVKGMAADIVIKGMTPLEVASLAHDLGLGGIKAYPTFTHIDVGIKRTW